jgi:NADH-quinone oxidoreductase subunit C/D
MEQDAAIIEELKNKFGEGVFTVQETADRMPTLWVPQEKTGEVLRWLKNGVDRPYKMLYDLTAIDERVRENRAGQPESDFTIVYHLLSFDRNEDIRIKTALKGDAPSADTITGIWPSANWYEREVWDLFGIRFSGHPHLSRILMPPTWEGHPLRKDHLGPHHPGTHGLLRIILELDGEEIADAVIDIGYHHRGAEKMGERQSWHTFIPYTDRIDYLGGVMNNLPYVLAVERLAGIEVPDKAKVIRVMMAEFFRIASHLVWYGTFAQDVGALSPVFFTFTDRERVFGIVEAICGGRMHPEWFRIGGVAQDLPTGWDRLVKEFIDYFPPRLAEYDTMIMGNSIFRARTQGIGKYTLDEAIEWGVTGPGLRACGFEWDFRKKRSYSGYDQFEFDIPTATHGDCYDRSVVRVEEMRQSLRIIKQCMVNMPEGPYKSHHPLTTPPLKERTMHDIETLIDHFLSVSWGPVIPAGEAFCGIEATKGNNGYYLISDGNTMSYRTRIRTPSFPHMQMVPMLSRGLMVSDLLAILGSIDFILADIDR